MEKVISREDLEKVLEKHMATGEVVAPVRDGELILFQPLKAIGDILLDYTNPLKPARECFLPSREELFGQAEPPDRSPQERKRMIFGVRPCDAQALFLLDKAFGGEYEDSYYLSKRARSILVGLACNDPERTCFCLSLGGGPHSKAGLDVLLTELGDGNYLVETVTPAGEELFEAYGKEAGKPEAEKKETLETEAKKKITKSCALPSNLESVFEHPYWEKVSRKCIGCGVCTYLCPTCYCFNLSYEGGKRVRYWDSCAFACFAA